METIKNSELINVLIPLIIIVFIIAVGVVLLYQHFQKNLFLHKLKEETMKRNHQSELLRANILVQEEERKRIANDVHDELGAVLSIMKMKMKMLERQSTERASELLPALQSLSSLAESAIASTRSISHRLMPPQLESFGLIKTLESVTAQINNTGNLLIKFSSRAVFPELPMAVSLGLYRVIMELVNNTIKHSGATEADVAIDAREGYIICQYTDNGKGLGSEATEEGLGHKSINSRISALDGTIQFGPPETKGFFATIQVPLHAISNTIIS